MSEGPSEPPESPEYVHPDIADKAEAITSDGARWGWTGAEWKLMAPPGTHADVVHRHEIVMPLLELAISLAREDGVCGEGAKHLWATDGCSQSALRDVGELLESTDNPLHAKAHVLVRSAL